MKVTKLIIYFISVIVAIFGLFIAYQILRIILGGSWNIEDVILTLLMFNLGAILTLMTFLYNVKSSISGLRSDHKHLSSQFKALANDFKEHLQRHTSDE